MHLHFSILGLIEVAAYLVIIRFLAITLASHLNSDSPFAKAIAVLAG